MRKGEWPEIAQVSGIECAGLVKIDPDGRLAKGQKVVALMGGMGRTINGSYAELTSVPATNVVPVETRLSWEALAAIPESYATAWTCLLGNLALRPGQTLVIRGATSALGQAALNIAVQENSRVIATSRNPDRNIQRRLDRKSTRLNSSHTVISYAVFCLKKKKTNIKRRRGLQ